MNKYEILRKGNQVAAVELNCAESEEKIYAYKSQRFIAQRLEIEAESQEQAIKIFSQSNTENLQVASAKEVSSNYSTGKKVYSFVEVVGWLLVVLGVLFTIAILAQLGSTYNTSSVVVISGIIPGLGLALGGLLSIASAQVMKATIATAENSQKILEQLCIKN